MDVQYDVPLDPIADFTTRDRVRRLLEERARSTRFAEAVAQKFAAPNV
jgi:hypothetical protein